MFLTSASAGWRRCALVLLFACAAAVQAQKQITLLAPAGVAYDAAGNLFFADTGRNQVFEVTLAGVLTVVAGTGEQGFAGDGSPAVSALLNAPQAVAVAQDGTLYIADTGNNRVRAVNAGTIQTVAGSGIRGFSGDGGPAAAATLNRPNALALDASGALLLCDSGNHRVRRVNTGVITTLAGSGVQGFAGDSGPALVAELDSPSGVAIMADGRVIIADSRNHRLRVVGLDGTIQTLAGTGVRGFSGDGGAATSANLFLPRGVSVTPGGGVLFADSDNHRVRSVNAQGIISTVAGDGWQGSAADASAAGAASLDSPRGVATAKYGTATLADSHNRLVREIAADGKLYIVAAPQPHASVVTFGALQTPTYGQSALPVSVTGNAATPQGMVTVQDSATNVGTAMLSGGSASVSLHGLSAGVHTLSASYAGDGLNPAASSSPTSLSVLPPQVVATPNAATMVYGQVVPQLTGIEAGILPQDAASVAVSFSTAATSLTPVGTYPITAALSGSGSGNYSLIVGPNPGSLQITQAQSTVALQGAQASYAGLPLVVSATIGSRTSGVPTGNVEFVEAGVTVARSTVTNGQASGTILAATAGTHVLTATYGGDANFLGSASAPLTVTVADMPDFTVSAGAPAQSVQAGLIASYGLALAPVGGPFTGSVAFSIAGLPAGAQASFTPQSVVPGATGASVSLNVQTPANLVERRSLDIVWFAFSPVLVLMVCHRRSRKLSPLLAFGFVAVLSACEGCGARTVATSDSHAARSFPLTVTATSTNIAGSIVTHSVSLTLTVQ